MIAPLPGTPAPPFTLPAAYAAEAAAAPIRTVSLSDYAGRFVLLCWYPRDFSFVCPTELVALSDRLDAFTALDCAVVGLSTDSVYAHRAWLSVPRAQNGVADLQFPLLSDAAHDTSRAYRLLNTADGTAARAALLVDLDGIIQYTALHSANVGRSCDELLRVLEAVQTGALCGSDWKPGRG